MKKKLIEYPALVTGYNAEVVTDSSTYILWLVEGIRGVKVRGTAYIDNGRWRVRVGSRVFEVADSNKL